MEIHDSESEVDLPAGTLAITLKKHQKVALAWMVQQEKNLKCSGGILADDQGLGKTVSMMALILKQRAEQNNLVSSGSSSSAQSSTNPAGGTLVVCPLSLLRQWEREFIEKISEQSRMTVLVYYGSNRTKDPFELASYEVVITTYSVVSNEVPGQLGADIETKQLEKHTKNKRKLSSIEEAGTEAYSGPLSQIRWFRVVLDEAHSIRNFRTQTARSCFRLVASKRWCLSGTPMQNSVDDLFSYCCFLKIEDLDVRSNYVELIKDERVGKEKLQKVLKLYMLRRTKGTCINGEPILDLPLKDICLTTIEFDNNERSFYGALEERIRKEFKACSAAGTVKKNYKTILPMLLKLRQACDHPFLVDTLSKSNLMRSDVLKRARELPITMVENLLKKLESPSAICTQCNESPDNAVAATCGHIFCHECVPVNKEGIEEVCPENSCNKMLTTSLLFTVDVLRAVCTAQYDTVTSISAASSTSGPNYDEYYESSKIKGVMNIILVMCADDDTQQKAIVFSQWTKMLDIIECHLNRGFIQYRRLDGSMNAQARERAIKDFNGDHEIRVMLMSLKAGSLGLNIVAASQVILLEPWWNPFVEDQAEDGTPLSRIKLKIEPTELDRRKM